MAKKAKSKSCTGKMGMAHEKSEKKHIDALEHLHKGIKKPKKAKK